MLLDGCLKRRRVIIPPESGRIVIRATMVKNSRRLREFELDLLRREKADPRTNFRIVNAMYREAVSVGALPLRNPLEGIEIDIRIARAVNNVREAA
jgi:uncharacterized protein YjfI (DUF2170 family)